MEAPALMSGRWFVVAVVGAGAICAAGVVFGVWWLTFVAGVALGVVMRARTALPAASLAGLLGWGVLLVWEQWRYGIGPAGHSLAAIMGFTRFGVVVPVVLTCLVGLLLGLTGAWLGSAARSVVFSGQPNISR
jgi:hypothetical protein